MENHGKTVSFIFFPSTSSQLFFPFSSSHIKLNRADVLLIVVMTFLFPVEIVAHNVGFRPSRQGGCRLDLESIQLGNAKQEGMQLAPKSSIIEPRTGAILHAYGIGKLFIFSLLSNCFTETD